MGCWLISYTFIAGTLGCISEFYYLRRIIVIGEIKAVGLSENLRNIRTRIAQACERVNRDPEEVKLLAVTKEVDNDMLYKLEQAGVSCFGENRIQQARTRLDLFPNIEWHFIGSLQTNKVRYCKDFSLIHSLDRLNLAKALSRRAEQWNQSFDVLVQVNIGGEKSKHGIKPIETVSFVKKIKNEFPNIRIKGLMGMAPFGKPEEARPSFRKLAQLQQDIITETSLNPSILSMGMSNDFEIAIEEGATLIRVGTALFEGEA